MKMKSIKLLLLSSFLLAGSVIGQDSTLYRVKLPSRRWAAQLRGVSGERTQSEQKTGTYDYWYGTHNFWIVLSGPYQMFLDRTGGSSFTEDTTWSGLDAIGKWVNGPDIIDVVSDSLLLDEFLNVRIPASTDDGDGDLIIVNASGDSAWIWNENTTTWNNWGRRSLHVGHQTGGMLVLGRWDGRYDDSVVLIAGEHFLLSPRADMDSLFYAHLDSANNELNLWIKGNIHFAPGADNDADLIMEDATGNQHWIWAENDTLWDNWGKRALMIGHADGTKLVLGKWDGRYDESIFQFRGEHFMMSPRADMDSLFYAHLDSANNEVSVWMKGNLYIMPGADDDADIILENTAGDQSWIWNEYEQYLNRRGMYLGHHTGGMLVLGRWDGQYPESMVVFRGEHFLMYPSIVSGVDSVFYVHIDSTNNEANLWIKGNIRFSAGADGDADLILEDSTGNQHWIWAESMIQHNQGKRGLMLGHATGAFIGLGKWDGHSVDSEILFRSQYTTWREHEGEDSLATLTVDSVDARADFWVSGSMVGGVVEVTAAGPTDDLDVSHVSVVYVNTTVGHITIGGFKAGIAGQVVRVVVTVATNNTILEHAEGANQSFYLDTKGDETITATYGGWTLVCNGTHWYEVTN